MLEYHRLSLKSAVYRQVVRYYPTESTKVLNQVGILFVDSYEDDVIQQETRIRNSHRVIPFTTDYDECYVNGQVFSKENTPIVNAQPVPSDSTVLFSWETTQKEVIGIVSLGDGWKTFTFSRKSEPGSPSSVPVKHYEVQARVRSISRRNSRTYLYVDYRYKWAYTPNIQNNWTAQYDSLELIAQGSYEAAPVEKVSLTSKTFDWFYDCTLPFTPFPRYEEAIREAVNRAKVLDINTVAYAQDLGKLLDLVKPLYRFNVSTAKNALKTGADIFLTEKYGWENLLRDTKRLGIELGQLIEHPVLSTSRGGKSETFTASDRNLWTYESFCTIRYNPMDTGTRTWLERVQKGIRNLWRYDIGTGESFWDIIPYSFVIDWFLPYGEALGQHDASLLAHVLPVEWCCTTERYMRSGEIATLGLFPTNAVGNGTIQFYRRRITKEIPPLHININHPQKGPIGHWAEGAALIISRI